MATWTNLSTSQKVAVTVGVSAGAAVLYICYSKYRNGQDPGALDVPRLVTEREMAAGKPVVVQTESNRVNQSPDVNGDQELTITGSPSQVRQAGQLVNGVLQEPSVIQEELLLPARSMCWVIGKRGERIREIGQISGASIHCEQKTEAASRRITLSGTREQVEAAKTLIQKEAATQRRDVESSSFRSHRKEIIAVKKKDVQPGGPGAASSSSTDASPGESPSHGDPAPDDSYPICKYEVPSPDFSFQAEEFVDVYVSAVESPEHFWIQMLGPRWLQLDKLTTEMSEHYQSLAQRGAPAIQVGDIVAAQFRQDSCWYRAEVIGFLEDGHVDLYYVDYGDCWNVPLERIRPLRSDYLSLPFQALECSLAGVSPAGGTWSEEAMNAFEELTHCAQWMAVLAKICSFPSPGITRCFLVRLYDPSPESQMLDIGEELIRRGFAVQPRLSADEESPVPRLVEEVLSVSVEPEACSFASRQERRHASDVLSSTSNDVVLIEDE